MKFYIVFFGVICASAVIQDEVKYEVKPAARSESSAWDERVVSTDLTSNLFKVCVAAANTRVMQYSFIEDPAQEIAFLKFEVVQYAKGLKPVNWTKEIESTDIIDCFKASKEYMMFQYDGGACRMSDEIYCYKCLNEVCAGAVRYQKEFVYINIAVKYSGCPAHYDDIVAQDGGPGCINVYHQDEPFDSYVAKEACDMNSANLYYQWYGAPTFTAVRNYMRSKNYQGNFKIDVYYHFPSAWYKWYIVSVNPSDFAIQPQEPYYQQNVVISSEHDYLLVATSSQDLITGFVCFDRL